MAKSTVYIFSIVVLMMASHSSPSDGLQILGYNIGRVIIKGVVNCSINGEPSPYSNATVFLLCGDSSFVLAEALTNLNGTFTVVLNVLQSILFDPKFCGLTVNLPPGTSCDVVTPDGVLSSTLQLIDIFLTNGIYTAVYRAGQFS